MRTAVDGQADGEKVKDRGDSGGIEKAGSIVGIDILRTRGGIAGAEGNEIIARAEGCATMEGIGIEETLVKGAMGVTTNHDEVVHHSKKRISASQVVNQGAEGAGRRGEMEGTGLVMIGGICGR